MSSIDWSQLPDSFWAEKFELGAKMSVGWWYSAHQLRRSADLIHDFAEEATNKSLMNIVAEFEKNKERTSTVRFLSDEESQLSLDSGLSGVAFMLLGLSIENLAKGILVTRNPEGVVKNGEFKLKKHGLVNLVNECNLSITDKERDLLETATEYIRWRGRYMIPLSSDSLRPKQSKNGEWKTMWDVFHRGDYDILASFCDRLFDILRRE